MKYTEFEKLMSDEGFHVKDGEYNIIVFDEGLKVATISKDYTNTFSTNYPDFLRLDADLRWYVAKQCVKLSFTELVDRGR